MSLMTFYHNWVMWFGIMTLLRGSPPIAKFTIFMKNYEDELAVRCVICRCFSSFDYFEIIKFISICDIKLNLFIKSM